MSALPSSVLVRLENALGAELLRADLLGAARPVLAERYEVRALLGRGARGVVVHAHDTRLDRQLALKLSPETLTDENTLAEARALAKLEHPNVVRVYDCDVTTATLDDQPFTLAFVSMELVRGATLRSHLAVSDRTTAEILQIFRAIGEGLAAVHDAGLVHRDVKPENVVVASNGEVKLIDFGFASMADDGSSAAGTRVYLAPEVGRGPQTPASDQYAFATALEEALAGRDDVPRHVSFAIAQGRAHAPSARHANMRAFLRALHPRAKLAHVLLGAVLGLGVVIAVCAFLMVRGARPDDAAQPADPCAGIRGTYSFTGRVTEATPDINHEQWSAYRMQLAPRGACRFHVEITKYTDDGATGFYDWRGTMDDVPAVVHANGEIGLDVQVTLARPQRTSPYEHAFETRIAGDTVTGSFDVLDRRAGFSRVYGGTLTGRRDRGTAARPTPQTPAAGE